MALNQHIKREFTIVKDAETFFFISTKGKFYYSRKQHDRAPKQCSERQYNTAKACIVL